MQRVGVGFVLTLSLAVAGCGGGEDEGSSVGAKRDHIFVADEDSGGVSVIEEGTNALVATLPLPMSSGMYMPHNVQAAPDGKSVWVVAPPMTEGGMEKAFVIDPETNQFVGDIELGTELHVAHVVLDPSSTRAYISANEGNAVLELDAVSRKVLRTIDLGADRGPHGMRWCRDRLWVANMKAKSLAAVEPVAGSVTEVDVGGVAVQTACVPGGKYVFVSLYDTKEVVRYEIDTQKLTRIALPAEAQGPVQLYPSPDSKTVWVCDQGLLLGRPASNRLYAVDVDAAKVVGTIQVGQGAHGIVLSDDGGLAYVTNVSDDSVSVVDTAKMEAVATIAVGTKPNGISHWHRSGAMP
ncbi:MAG: hypothetical protein IPI67_24110 [Myxococcales bacterium]|nr:hypothetical protein [Myxococcales bacterium]